MKMEYSCFTIPTYGNIYIYSCTVVPFIDQIHSCPPYFLHELWNHQVVWVTCIPTYGGEHPIGWQITGWQMWREPQHIWHPVIITMGCCYILSHILILWDYPKWNSIIYSRYGFIWDLFLPWVPKWSWSENFRWMSSPPSYDQFMAVIFR